MAALSSRQAKVDWLAQRPKMWEGWPRGQFGGDARLWEIVDAMKKDGLIAKSTYPPDIHMQSLINAARKKLRAKKVNHVKQTK